jgi:hypothetical protein
MGPKHLSQHKNADCRLRNGFGIASVIMFTNFLNEIAKYLLLHCRQCLCEDTQLRCQTTYQDLINSVNQLESIGIEIYNLELSRLAVAGQLCG